jgi:lysophospholipase L1-like esterase
MPSFHRSSTNELNRCKNGRRVVQQSRHTVFAESFFAILGRSVATVIVVAILAELCSFALLLAYGRFHRDPLVPQKSPAYDSEKWGREFWAEQSAFWAQARSNYLPFMVWGVRKWHGKFINTDDTEMGTWRRTVQAASDGCGDMGVRKVWVFGGSTVYGIGTPDWATIPSYLSRELNTNPSACVEVTNLGVEGYVTNQEVILLSQQLKAGRKPDIAIFYDGINESLVGGFSPGIPTAHWNFEMIKTRFENGADSKQVLLNNSHLFQLIKVLLENYGQKGFPSFSDAELTTRAQATLQNYETNLRLVHLLESAYGFKTYFFWQPTLAYGAKPLAPFEQELEEARNKELGGRVHRGLNAVYQEAETRSSASESFVFLGHVFDKVQELIYVDEFHLDPRGNQIIARAIAQALRLDSPR